MFEEKEQQNGFPGSALMVNGGWLMAKAKEERRRKEGGRKRRVGV